MNSKRKITLIDDKKIWEQLLPLTFVRNVAQCRVGILTLKDKWEIDFNADVSLEYCIDYLQDDSFESKNSDFIINSALFPTKSMIEDIINLEENTAIYNDNIFLAARGTIETANKLEYNKEYTILKNPWDIFLLSDQETRMDYKRITAGRTSQSIDTSNQILGTDVFIEEGAKVQCAILNATSGPIYISKDSEVMEGSMIRGPFSLGEHSQLKMGSKIYGSTNIGPHCKVGGEITNSVFFGFSNKAHDGYLGNSVIAEWCNLGADTNSSNLKNNYSKVDVYSYKSNSYISTGQQFCGLIMGDYSKSGINTMFNTGTVVGVSANIFGGGFPSKHIPSFSWCSIVKNELYKLEKALDTIEIVYQRRGLTLTERTKNVLKAIFEHNQKYSINK